METILFTPTVIAASWPAQLDGQPITLSWSAAPLPPALGVSPYTVTLAHLLPSQVDFAEIAQLDAEALNQLSAAVREHLSALSMGVVRPGVQIYRPSQTFTVLGHLTPALRLTIRIEREGQPSQTLTLDQGGILHAITTMGRIQVALSFG